MSMSIEHNMQNRFKKLIEWSLTYFVQFYYMRLRADIFIGNKMSGMKTNVLYVTYYACLHYVPLPVYNFLNFLFLYKIMNKPSVMPRINIIPILLSKGCR